MCQPIDPDPVEICISESQFECFIGSAFQALAVTLQLKTNLRGYLDLGHIQIHRVFGHNDVEMTKLSI